MDRKRTSRRSITKTRDQTGRRRDVTPGNMAYLRTIFPRKNGIPPENLEPPSKPGNTASWTLNFLGYLVPHAKFPRIFGTPSKISQDIWYLMQNFPGYLVPHAKFPRIAIWYLMQIPV